MTEILAKASFEEIVKALPINCVEASLAIRAGKLAPFGYERVLDFIKSESGEKIPAHDTWLEAEAYIANKLEDLRREFPDIEEAVSGLIEYFRKICRDEMTDMEFRINRPDYSFDHARAIEKRAAEIENTHNRL